MAQAITIISKEVIMEQPVMHEVQSSNIARVGYDETNSIVWIEFINGSMYVYFDVPIVTYNELKEASSVGSYFNRNYKNQFAYQRIC